MVCQVKSATQFTMQVQICDVPIKAVVDTAAQVTIISDKVYHALKKPPRVLRDVKLLTACRQLSMAAFVAGPVRMRIGHKWYKENLYVAPIEQDMLLGFDILQGVGKAVLDMGRGTLLFDEMHIILDVDSSEGPIVSRVTAAKRRVVPPIQW